jgi:hypothetical protein
MVALEVNGFMGSQWLLCKSIVCKWQMVALNDG